MGNTRACEWSLPNDEMMDSEQRLETARPEKIPAPQLSAHDHQHDAQAPTFLFVGRTPTIDIREHDEYDTSRIAVNISILPFDYRKTHASQCLLRNPGQRFFLGIELGIDQLRASIVDESLDLVGVECIDFDSDLPEYQYVYSDAPLRLLTSHRTQGRHIHDARRGVHDAGGDVAQGAR